MTLLSAFPLLHKLSFAQTVPDQTLAKGRQGVRVLRLFNSVQAWHKGATGGFGTLEQLRSSEAVKQLLADNYADQTLGMGRRLYESLRLDNSELLPGWRLKLVPTEERKSYIVAIL